MSTDMEWTAEELAPIFPSYWTPEQRAAALVSRDQAVADATVAALSRANLLRSPSSAGVLKRVVRNQAGQIVSIIEEPVVLQDAS